MTAIQKLQQFFRMLISIFLQNCQKFFIRESKKITDETTIKVRISFSLYFSRLDFRAKIDRLDIYNPIAHSLITIPERRLAVESEMRMRRARLVIFHQVRVDKR